MRVSVRVLVFVCACACVCLCACPSNLQGVQGMHDEGADSRASSCCAVADPRRLCVEDVEKSLAGHEGILKLLLHLFPLPPLLHLLCQSQIRPFLDDLGLFLFQVVELSLRYSGALSEESDGVESLVKVIDSLRGRKVLDLLQKLRNLLASKPSLERLFDLDLHIGVQVEELFQPNVLEQRVRANAGPCTWFSRCFARQFASFCASPPPCTTLPLLDCPSTTVCTDW